jgi:hypothetical protein
MIFIGIIIGGLIGQFILGGIYYTFFVSDSVHPNSPRGRTIGFIWIVIGAIIGGLIMS